MNDYIYIIQRLYQGIYSISFHWAQSSPDIYKHAVYWFTCSLFDCEACVNVVKPVDQTRSGCPLLNTNLQILIVAANIDPLYSTALPLSLTTRGNNNVYWGVVIKKDVSSSISDHMAYVYTQGS